MVRTALFATALCLCVVTWPSISDAQINPFQSSRTGLRGNDLTLMNAAASQLYQQDTVTDGAASHWSNSKTGNSGTVTVLHSLEKAGMACRRVRYVIHLRGVTGQRDYTVNWCKTASGEWKIA
jgi:17 kDa outer membrane surface antigen